MRWLVVAGALGCASEVPCGEVGRSADGPRGGNVLLVVLDDVGLETVDGWGHGVAPARTPTLDCLCDRGVTFTSAWGAPMCSPSRAMLLTGQYARRHDMGTILREEDDHELPLAARTLGEVFLDAGYRTGFFGKWHLSTERSPSGRQHPNLQGFERFDGTIGNVRQEALGYDYFTWPRVVDGVAVDGEEYLTTATTSAARAWIESAETEGMPWLAVVSLHAAHEPVHRPPDALLAEPLPEGASERAKYLAMLEAADTALGELLRELDPGTLARTTILVVSDNGSPKDVLPDAMRGFGGKETVNESGLRVPLVVAGAAVEAPGSRDVPVHVVDIVPTLASLAGVAVGGPVDGLDLSAVVADASAELDRALLGDQWFPVGVSWPERDHGEAAVREGPWKLVRRDGHPDGLHHIGAGLDDGPDLLGGALDPEAAAALERLNRAYADLERALNPASP